MLRCSRYGLSPIEEHSVQFFDKIKTYKNLPSLPQILLRLIELCNDEESKIKDISQIISTDTSLSAKVMSMVSSSNYELSQKVPDIDKALIILGKNAIKNIVISSSVTQIFIKEKNDSVFGLKVFWRHSLMCAILSKLIAKKILYASPDEAFLAGLLHDIGKLVLWTNFPRKDADILTSSKYEQDLIVAGGASHCTKHCEVGARLIKRWNLQSFMTDAVFYHHESLDRIKDASPLVKIIYVGNVLCPETNKEMADKFGIAKNIFGFELSELEAITLQAEEEVNQIAQSLDIDIDTIDGSGSAVSEKDYKKQECLVKEVKDIALLQGTLQNLLGAHDEDSILKVVHQGLDILFDIKHVLIFLYESERNILLGKNVSANKQYNLINEVRIPLQKGKSLLAKSLLQGNPLDSFSDSVKDDPTIVDEQLIRLVEKDGILCLPMAAYKQYLGVIVLGLEEVRYSNLSEVKKRLLMFTKQVALALHANYVRQSKVKVIEPVCPSTTSTIARKVAHDVNTPLSIIKNYLAVLRGRLPEDESFQEKIRIINDEINGVSVLMRELFDSSKPETQSNNPLDLNSLLSNQIRIFQESLMLGPNINTHLKLEPSLPMVLADKNKMKQIFSNLIMNAVEAMPRGGNLYISTRYVSNYSDAEMKSSADSTQGHLQISIRDDGPGIVDTVKSRLFEPNVTSKGVGHAGIGLSTVYSNVKELKGTIACENDDKIGASFKIVFPITQDQQS